MAAIILSRDQSRIPVFGVQDVKASDITRLPEGTQKVRLRIRNNEFARVFIKTENAARQFILFQDKTSGEFFPDLEQGANVRK